LLGLQSHILPEVEATPAEMTYGTPIRLPGDFFEEQKPITDLPVFVFKLKEQMRILKPVPTTHHTSRKVFVHLALHFNYEYY
jgi:hypothetical protein